MDPYRQSADREAPAGDERSAGHLLESDLLYPAVLYWIIALVTVISAIRQHATFGAGETISAAVVVLGLGAVVRAVHGFGKSRFRRANRRCASR